MALADPEQIASLGSLAADTRMSFFADRANRFRISRPRAEEILLLDPDLVIAAPFTNTQLRNFLRDRGLRIVEMGGPQTFADILAEIRMIASLIHQEERGEALVVEIEAARSAALGAGAGHSLLYLQRRGFANGRETLFAEIVDDLGFENALTEVEGVQRIPLEELVGLRPDAVLAALDQVAVSGPETAVDQGMALLAHPALKAGFSGAQWFALPPALTVCPGPATMALYQRLTAFAENLDD